MGHSMGLLDRSPEFWAACGAERVDTLLRGLGSTLEWGVHAAALSCWGGERGSH